MLKDAQMAATRSAAIMQAEIMRLAEALTNASDSQGAQYQVVALQHQLASVKAALRNATTAQEAEESGMQEGMQDLSDSMSEAAASQASESIEALRARVAGLTSALAESLKSAREAAAQQMLGMQQMMHQLTREMANETYARDAAEAELKGVQARLAGVEVALTEAAVSAHAADSMAKNVSLTSSETTQPAVANESAAPASV
eukprot:4526027-Prymnesium_polylepis.1